MAHTSDPEVQKVDLDKMEVFCLNGLCDDYENVSSVLPGVSRGLGRPVTESEVAACLRRLAERKLIDVYGYDAGRKQYRRVAIADVPSVGEGWFMISDLGQKELDSNWEKENQR